MALSDVTPQLLQRIAENDMASRERVADVVDDWEVARVVADGRAPDLVEYNHAGLIRADESSADALIAKAERFFQKRGRPPALYLDSGTQPSDTPERLAARGWGKLPGPPRDLMLWDPAARHIYTTAQVYMTMATNATIGQWIDMALADTDPRLHEQATAMLHLEFRAPGKTFWFGLYDGLPAGVASLFVKDGIGQVGRVTVLPEFRGKGVGLALVNYLTRQSRKDGADETYLFNDHGGPATGLCRTAGYHTVAPDARQVWTLPGG